MDSQTEDEWETPGPEAAWESLGLLHVKGGYPCEAGLVDPWWETIMLRPATLGLKRRSGPGTVSKGGVTVAALRRTVASMMRVTPGRVFTAAVRVR